MKIGCVAALAVSLMLTGVQAKGAETHLFILSGQSNMQRLDPNLSFTPAVEAEFGAENVAVVHDAQGGQPIREWYKKWKPLQGDEPKATGKLYDRLMEKVRPVMEERSFDTVTFVWMQGEADAKEHGEVYAASLMGLYVQLQADLGRDDVRFVIGRLSDHDPQGTKYPQWSMVRQAQMQVADSNPRFDWVSTDDLNDGINARGKTIKNNLHYSVEGYRVFGKRLADKSIELIGKSPHK